MAEAPVFGVRKIKKRQIWSKSPLEFPNLLFTGRSFSSRNGRVKRFFIPFFAAVALFSHSAALASNAKSFPMGDDAAMTAMTIGAVTRDSEAIWYNPAGLGGNQLSRLTLSGNVFMVRFQNIGGGMAAELPSGKRYSDVNTNEFLAVPAAMTFMRKATDSVSYGFGVYVPQYADITFDSSLSSVEQFPTVAEPLLYQQGFTLDMLDMQYQLGGAVGWQPMPELRVGAGLFFLYDRARQSRSLFESIESADGSDATSLFYLDSFRVLLRTIGVRATGGAQWEVSPSWRLGLLLESPMIQIYSWGNATLATSTSSRNAGGGQVQSANRNYVSISQFEGKMLEPFHAQLSVAYVQPSYWVGLAADIYTPLKEPSLYIDKKLNWNVSVGGKISITKKIDLGVGLFTDRSDSSDPAEFGDAKIDYYGVTAGAQFLTPISRGEGAEPPVVFRTALGLRYALGIGTAGGLSFNPLTDGNISDARSDPVNVRFHELSVYLGTALFF